MFPDRNQYQFSKNAGDGHRSARAAEYAAFAKVNRELRFGTAQGKANDRRVALVNNIQLWTVIAEDLSGKANALPDVLKADLLSLSIFAIKYSYGEIGTPRDLTPLIDVNAAMMKALREG